jgi:hypothetical protein
MNPSQNKPCAVPHVAYVVESLEDALAGGNVVAEPFDVFGDVRVAFIEVDGAPVEFVQPY